MIKLTSSDDKLHSLIWNIILYFAIVFFGETICGGLAGLRLDASAFAKYELFTEIELLLIAIATVVGRGIGIAAARSSQTSDDGRFWDVCADGIRLCVIIGAILAAGSMIVFRFLFSFRVTDSFFVCCLSEALLAFLLPLLCTLRELVYIRRKLSASILSAVAYIAVYFLFTYFLIDLGWTTDAVLFAHTLAVITVACILFFSLRRSGLSLQSKSSHKKGETMRILLSGLPIGLGYVLYTCSVYLFSQVTVVPASAEESHQITLTYGSLSFGLQIMSLLISIILLSSSMLVLVSAKSFTEHQENSSERTVLRRLLTVSGIVWFTIGVILFFAAPIFTDAMRITSDNEINITLIGIRICALTVWAHSLIWILIQYHIIKRNYRMLLVLSAPLLLGFVLMIVVHNLLPDEMIIAWLLFACTPFLSLLAARIFRKKAVLPDFETDASAKRGICSFLPGIKQLIPGLLAAVVFVGGLISSSIIYYEIDMLPDISDETLFNFENRSKIIANDGVTVLADLYYPRHETIKDLNEVSPYVVWAVVAREDGRFYEHHGIDPRGIARAAFATVTGQGMQGGSTITMQLIKNSILSNTGQLRTFDRKISEIILALRMERVYDKNTILTMYLNNVNFGNGYYGIKSASKHYFRKDPKDLTLAEAVSLSTLIQMPNHPKMTSNDEFALKARARTLNRMVSVGYITEDEAQEASSQRLDWDPFEVIVNHSKVTPAMTTDPIIVDQVAYMAVDDVARYLDPYLYCGVDEGVIATFGSGGVAEFDLAHKTVTVNGETKPVSLQKSGNTYYLPLPMLADLYGIDVYQDDNTLLITSRDRATIRATVVSDTPVNYLNSKTSYSVGTAHQGDTVYVQDTDGDVYDGWARVRTDDNLVGYVKTDRLAEQTVEKQAVPTVPFLTFDKPFRITWDMTANYASAARIIADSNGAYNVVMPFCYGVKGGKVINRNGMISDHYLQMYENEGYHCFPTFDYAATDEQEMDAMSELLGSYFSRKALIQQILSYVDDNHLRGINIDFEHMYMKDGPNFTQFIRELKAQLEPRGCLLFLDIIAPDGDDNWAGCYEYWKLGMTTDYMILMAYDFTSKHSDTPGSGAPYYWVRRSVDKLVKRENVSSDKVIVSLPLYMRIWDLDPEKGTVIDSADFGIADIDNAIPKDAVTTWPEEEKQHFIEFTDSKGVPKQLWKEDLDSLSAKIQLIPEYRLPGVAFWLENYSNSEINASLARAMDRIIDGADR